MPLKRHISHPHDFDILYLPCYNYIGVRLFSADTLTLQQVRSFHELIRFEIRAVMQEREWILMAQKGDGDAFCALIGKYENKIYNIAYKFMQNSFDAQDAAQDAIIKMYRSIRKFSFQSAFSTWMYRVVANTCLDALRARRPSVPMEEYSDAAVSREGNPDEQAENSELGSCLLYTSLRYFYEKIHGEYAV